jgi:hypothetical protein
MASVSSTTEMPFSPENPPTKQQILDAIKDKKWLAAGHVGTLEIFPAVQELLAEGGFCITQRTDLTGKTYEILIQKEETHGQSI